MKKILIFVLVFTFVMLCFIGCDAHIFNKSDNSVNMNQNYKVRAVDENEIKDTNAISLIKSYTLEELGLSGSMHDYTFLVSSEKVIMDEEEYFKIVAGSVNESGKADIYTIEEINHYLVSDAYDKVLVYDKKANSYNPLANVHSLPDISGQEQE